LENTHSTRWARRYHRLAAFCRRKDGREASHSGIPISATPLVNTVKNLSKLHRVERHALQRAAAFLTTMLARPIDQDSAHGCGGDRHEMCATLPLHSRLVDQPHIRFVNQRRRAERVASRLLLQLPVRQAAQLVVDVWKNVGYCACIAGAGANQQIGIGVRRFEDRHAAKPGKTYRGRSALRDTHKTPRLKAGCNTAHPCQAIGNSNGIFGARVKEQLRGPGG
jgi:hypothetical protein